MNGQPGDTPSLPHTHLRLGLLDKLEEYLTLRARATFLLDQNPDLSVWLDAMGRRDYEAAFRLGMEEVECEEH